VRPKWSCLVAALAVMCGIAPITAWAHQRPANPDVGPNTIELHSDRIKFQIIPDNEQPPAGFEQPGFDDAEFSTGSGPFASGGTCPLQPIQPTVATNWPIKTRLIIRRVVPIEPENGRVPVENVRVLVAVNNDIINIFWNGTRIGGPIRHEGCPVQDEFRFDVPQQLLLTGENLVAFDVLDRGTESFFDARILAEVAPDQLSDTVIVQQTPAVPVRNPIAICSVDPDLRRRSTMIPYGVAATGEFGEIRVEQSEQELAVETLLGGESVASASASADKTTTSRSSNATERLSRFDPGILSPPVCSRARASWKAYFDAA
jgi:hypothetical protein